MKTSYLILMILTAAAAACLLYGFFLEPRWIRVRKFRLARGPHLEGLSILFFSDLHLGRSTSEGKLDRLIRKIMKYQPDALIFGGDLVEEKTPLYDPAFRARILEALDSLQAPLGKWAIYGNHDVEAPRFRKWVTEILQDSGFQILENSQSQIGGLPVWGFANTHHGLPALDKGAFNKAREKSFRLFLVHECDWYPAAMPWKGPGLVLSGHSHYGQVTLLGLPLIRPAGAKKYWRGSYKLGEKLGMIVSAGVGTVHIHARFFARPDLILLNFEAE